MTDWWIDDAAAAEARYWDEHDENQPDAADLAELAQDTARRAALTRANDYENEGRCLK
jgi:hypothetical protein